MYRFILLSIFIIVFFSACSNSGPYTRISADCSSQAGFCIASREKRKKYEKQSELKGILSFSKSGFDHVTSIALSPNGKLALTAEYSGRIDLWDIKKKKKIRSMKSNDYKREYILFLKFLPNGKEAVSSNLWGEMRFWDIEKGKQLYTLNKTKNRRNYPVIDMSFYPKNKLISIHRRLVTDSNGYLYLWDLDSKSLVYKIDKDRANSIAVSKKYDVLALGDLDGNVTIHDINNLSILKSFNFKGNMIQGIDFYDNNTILIAVTDNSAFSEKGEVSLWYLDSGKKIKSYSINSAIITAKFSKNKIILALANTICKNYSRVECTEFDFSFDEIDVSEILDKNNEEKLIIDKNRPLLTVRSNLYNDIVYINGKNYGSTRLDISLPIGKHHLRIEKPGYQSIEKIIYLDSSQTIKFKLKKSKGIKKIQNAISNHKTLQHIVQIGESLTEIAYKYHCNRDDLIKANNLPIPPLIKVGQVIIIPACPE